MVGKVDVRYRIDVETLRRDESATTLELNDLARVHLELSSPLVFDSYRRNRVTGSLIVIDEATNDTVAAGVILDTEVEERGEPEPKSERSPNVRWQGTRMTRERRWRVARARRRDAVVHGPARRGQVDGRGGRRGAPARRPASRRSCSTATTCATASTATSASTRTRAAENVRRTAHVARLLAESGTVALVSLVSPYAADRQAAAALHAADDLGFLEIFVDAPLELCEQRDPKGLYARARAGELDGHDRRRRAVRAARPTPTWCWAARGNGRGRGRARDGAARRERGLISSAAVSPR